MKKQKTVVLQIGLFNWQSNLSVEQTSEMEWHFLNLGSDTNGFREGYSNLLKRKQFDLVLCTDEIRNDILIEFSELMESYRLIVDEMLEKEVVAEIINHKCPVFLDVSDTNKTIEIIRQFFFPNEAQQGTKFQVNEVTISSNFYGQKKFVGQNFIELTGSFSSGKHQPLLSWQYNIEMRKRSKKIWLEFEHSDDMSITLCVMFLENLTGNILKIEEYSEHEVKSGIEINYEKEIAYLGLTLKAFGEGYLRVGALHYRDSRGTFGEYIPGGKKLFDKNNQEIFYYFNPGDMKPPLTVYFSGYRPAEGFEGFQMMKRMGRPFLLFTDPRLEGGAFYLGSKSLEKQVIKTIEGTLDILGFTQHQLVLSGLSMGTFGALYYGCQITPHTIIVGKPLVNLGTMAYNSKLIRPGQFETSLDILFLATKEVSENGITKLNEKFWSAFDSANFSNTKFKVAYMKNDDYDSQAYEGLLKHLFDKGNTLIGKGIPGRHNDDSAAINQWFLAQFRETLKTDFSTVPLNYSNEPNALTKLPKGKEE